MHPVGNSERSDPPEVDIECAGLEKGQTRPQLSSESTLLRGCHFSERACFRPKRLD